MDFLTKGDAQKWCAANRIPLNERGLPVKSAEAQRFEIPSDTGKRVVLVKRQLGDLQYCEEVLIWITDWSIWQSGERMHIFNRFRQSYGESRVLMEIPAHRVSKNEYEDGLSLVTLAVLFLWDCYVLTKGNQKFYFYSHDEFGLTLS